MAWAEEQVLVWSDGGGAGSTADTFGSSCVSGNLVEVNFSARATALTAVTSATVTVGGAALTQVATERNPDLADGFRCWKFRRVLGASGAHEVEITFSEAHDFIRVTAKEFSGNAAASELDDFSTGTGSGTAPSSGNMDPTQAGDLISGYGLTQSGDISAGSGFTVTSNVDDFDESEWLEQGTAATIDADFASGDAPWIAIGAAYKAAGGGGDTNARLIGGDLLHSNLFQRLVA